ncbi:MAG: bfpA [Gammaproteobacteria bacterium]|jgi:type II secretory pathway pseudopilin PulG|nr:bfpA [Gammaproteobacteria bacterium]
MASMKKFLQKIAGVTLLEIMLVLAIAAMVIVMSIRYYQSASLNQQINAAVQAVTSVIAAGESYRSGTGSYAGINDNNLKGYLPKSQMPVVWGQHISTSIVAGATGAYTITIPVPAAACLPLTNLLINGSSKVTAGTNTCDQATPGNVVVNVNE